MCDEEPCAKVLFRVLSKLAEFSPKPNYPICLQI